MKKDCFKFFLYRINKEYRFDLFSSQNFADKKDDEWLEKYLISICTRDFDFRKETPKAIYTWSLRNYKRYNSKFSSIVLAKSQLQKTSSIVTDNSITTGESISSPPPAETIILLIYWTRHIVIVENRPGMTTGETWLRNLHAIIDNAKSYISFPIAPRLEPIPIKGSIIHHLQNFDKVFRFRIKLKLPNPELNRWSKRIYDEMIEERLQEYLQEFISPNGIKVDESSKAFSSAALAELGYKEGGVQIEGEKNGHPLIVDEGKTAIKGKADQLRSFIRGLETNATGKQLNNALDKLENEVNRLFPNEE